MEKVRFGIIGVGNMGRAHAQSLLSDIKGAELAAVCDTSPERLDWAEEHLPDSVQRFLSPEELFKSGTIDAVLIATPHYDHPPLAIEALGYGLHVLIEKPAGVYTKAVQEMNDAAAKSDRKFGIMYNQRTNPLYQKLRELIKSGSWGRSGGRTGLSPIGTAHRATMIPAAGGRPGAEKAEVYCLTRTRISWISGSGRRE